MTAIIPTDRVSPAAPPPGDLGARDATAGLRRLMTWLSPAFPVGAFSYSHGLEWAVEAGDVRSAAALAGWIADVLRHGGGRNDAILLVHAWRAATAGEGDRLSAVAELGIALAASRERHLETSAQGAAFLAGVGAAWPADGLEALTARLPDGVPYPVAVGAATAVRGIGLDHTLAAYLLAFAGNLVSAGVRLVPLGQTDGLRALAGLDPIVADLAAGAPRLTLDDLGGAAFRADIAAMRHETQYTRLFRS